MNWKLIGFALLIAILLLFSFELINRTEIYQKQGSYAVILRVHDLEYIGGMMTEGNALKYEIDKCIGQVSRRTEPSDYPENNYESNFLEAGTKIYSVFDSDIVIAYVDSETFIFKPIDPQPPLK